SVVKVWDDNGNRDGVRPDIVTVVLSNGTDVVATATLNDSNDWSASFTDLPVYNNGKLIEYSINELEVANYTSIVSVDGAYSFTVVNSHVPVLTNVSVVKVWDDNGNRDGVRPVSVDVVLLADGNVVGTATLNANNNWYASFEELPVYNNGKLISYSVEELEVANYTSVVSSVSDYSFIVNNTHVPVVTSVDVTKVWNDANDQDGVRPAEVTVVLVSDGKVINTAVLNANNNWHASFKELPVYSNGELIKYSVEEISVANYTSVVSSDSAYSFIVNNTHVPLITVVNITKVWRDDNNKNEEPVKVIIYADGVEVANVTLYPGNDWKFTYDDLPAYKDGKKINYTIGVVEGNRTVNMTGDNGNFTIIAEPVYNPDMTVQKITLDTEVEVGDLVSFEIVVENTGDCDLTGIYVIDNEYSEGLVFEYMEPNDDWTYEGNGKFTYNGILGVGESTSFIVVFTATTVGFKVNTVTAGNNLTNKTVNSTNTTNVTEEVPPEPDVPEDEPDVPQKHHVPKHVKPDKHATGNPILLLLLALVIPIIRRKQK
ncbi:MAG: Cna B-type domain-containing protein, partial [Methanobrevibacter sp.]|nr:Cna B-type domain-containing protein [Methanobrevibacter sp.]